MKSTSNGNKYVAYVKTFFISRSITTPLTMNLTFSQIKAVYRGLFHWTWTVVHCRPWKVQHLVSRETPLSSINLTTGYIMSQRQATLERLNKKQLWHPNVGYVSHTHMHKTNTMGVYVCVWKVSRGTTGTTKGIWKPSEHDDRAGISTTYPSSRW